MKRTCSKLLIMTVVFCAFFLLLTCNAAGWAENAPEAKESGFSFVLPASIRVIGDEAFEGTALQQAGGEAFRENSENSFASLIREQQGGETLTDHRALILPDSLTVIEEEAFEGIRASHILLPESLEVIGRRAFAGLEKLEAVYIPDSVRLIADDAFEDAGQLNIYGSAGGYAEAWAQQHGFTFVQLFMPISLGNGSLHLLQYIPLVLWLSAAAAALLILADNKGRGIDEGKTMRPQERAELNDIHLCFP